MKTLAGPINKLRYYLRHLIRAVRLAYWGRYLAEHATELRPEALAKIADRF